jgi:hypothetical protein
MKSRESSWFGILDSIPGAKTLIESATCKVLSSLADHPSLEKQAHLRAMQEQLAKLNNIIERQLKRDSRLEDGHQWSVTLAELLSLQKKAGIVSAAFVKRLPKEFDRLRTDVNQAESFRPENRDNTEQGVEGKAIDSESKRRAKFVEQVLIELKQIRPEMVNESHYGQVQQAHARFKIFRVAKKLQCVKEWLENIQGRRDLVKLAQEITARHFGRSYSTIQSDWSHRKSSKRGSNK